VILLDTNLLTRLTSTAHPHGIVARVAVHRLLAGHEQITIVPQNLFEFWAVATRGIGPRPSGENGLGFTIEQASQWLAFFQRRFTLLPDRADLVIRWAELVKTLGIRGFRSHDARLVAAMQCYGMTRVLTFNLGDFKRFPITVVDPVSV
jgi:predicted nucleic acid-binding protein